MAAQTTSSAREKDSSSYWAMTVRAASVTAAASEFSASPMAAGLRRGDLAFAIAADHGQRATGEIAQAVGEVAVVAGEQGVVAEIAVLAEGHVAQQVIAQRVDADGAGDGLGVSDIAFGFAHLLLLEKQPAVGEDTLRQRLLRGHEKGRPVDAMEANDLLADQMELRGPIFFPLQLIVAIADAAQIAGERVVPDVDDVVGIVRPGQAPLDGFAADGDIAQAGLDKTLHLVAAEGGADEIGLVLVELEELVLEGGELEEVVLLGNDFRGTAAKRAIDGIGGVGDVEIVENAVTPLIKGFVDESGIASAKQQAAHGAEVIERSGADEMRVADAQLIPQVAENRGVAVHVFARRDARLGCRAGDIFAVLVGAGDKGHVVTLHALKAGDRIGHQGGISRANVRARVGVVDWRGEIVARTVVAVSHRRSEAMR